MKDLKPIISQFDIIGTINEIKPLGNGLINDTYKVTTLEDDAPDYVLQRINDSIFTDVDLLQHNIEEVTTHIRQQLEKQGADDIDRKVLTFVKARNGKTYVKDEDQQYWRISVFIPRAITQEAVNPESSYYAGKTFGEFEAQLTDITDRLGETIPDFHNMELRRDQLRQAVKEDRAGRAEGVKDFIAEIESYMDEMCLCQRLFREGKLQKHVCHCDTKVNNMMFDEDGKVLCVIDLDTVMPSFIFSDYGDFLRTGANTGDEDDKDLNRVNFNMEIFKAFTKGYLKGAKSFLTPIEIENLPYAAALFPYMQCVRFLADYINGDTYYKIKYPEHNLVRTKAQFKLLQSVEEHTPEMVAFINECLVNG